MMATDIRAVPDVLRELRTTPPPGGRVLSVYLDTSPGRVAGQGYLLAFRDGCKVLRESLPPTEQDAFEAAVAQTESYLTQTFVPQHPGLVVFAGGVDYFYAVHLPGAPADDIAWAEEPELAPLEQALDDYERTAILLFDKERARLFTLFLGEIEERRAIEDEVPGKQATGGWFALAQTRYARHHEDHVLRHARRASGLLMELLRSHPFDRLILGGPDEAVALLRQHLPRPLRTRLAATVSLELFASDEKVRKAALEVAERLERQRELAMVDELLEAATSSYTAQGLEATLAALDERRVHLLLLADSFTAPGVACRACGRLAAAGEWCGLCQQPTTPLADLRERLVARAVDQGARVEIVSGEAAERLQRYGGLGAWTRY